MDKFNHTYSQLGELTFLHAKMESDEHRDHQLDSLRNLDDSLGMEGIVRNVGFRPPVKRGGKWVENPVKRVIK